MRTGITVLGSGSKGNSLLIHSDSSAILVDAGFSRKEFLKRVSHAKIDVASIKALLITHEHVDHVKGARVIADYLDIPTYTVSLVFKHLRQKNLVGKTVELFHSGTEFLIDIFKIQPFSVPHDSLEPFGFVIHVHGKSIGIATDLGHLSNLVKFKLKTCDALILESNHDAQMLMQSERTIHLKRRIRGKFGHLNNQEAMSSLEHILHDKTKHIVFYHLSSDCNKPELIVKSAQDKLNELNRSDIRFAIARQNEIIDTVWI